MKIILDFDDVIVDTLGSVCKLYNKETGSMADPSHFTEWDVDKVYKDFSKYFYLFDFSNAIEKNNSLKYVKELCNNHDVYIATASHIDKFNQKYLWLLKHAPFIKEDNIMLIKDKSLLRGDIIVDDAPHNFGGDFKYKFIYNSNHNINCDLKGVKRIDTLKEIVDFVYQIDRNHI